MKNISIFRIITMIITGLFLTNCHSHSKNILAEEYSGHDMKKLMIHVNDTAKAQKDTYSDFQKFIKEAYTKLDKNELSISKLRLESNVDKEATTRSGSSEIEDLKNSNNSFKRKLDNYIQNGNGNWQTFKSEFYCGLEELENECNNVTDKFIQ